ncbi:Transcriptional regulator, AraC family [hydrothermal vent metagenome]|uniref:Transcriptional regulator, AraC family n=1 Tax=hydrothermal vent metagenome TaxID=652676 RepID=A0A1W1EBE0_9ZZZZ
MKKKTQLQHSKLANDTMYYIYKYIDTDINIDELAKELGVSKFHFHRIFREQMGMNIYETIKSIRLQKASNLLITNKFSTITEIANMCGYSSQTSFIRAFKERFEVTPKFWRNGGYKNYSDKILKSSPAASISKADYTKLEPKIVKMDAIKAYYIRQKGYSSNLVKVWQKMIAWIYTNEIQEYEQIGIYHDNPIITPLEDCFYIAAVEVKSSQVLKNTQLPSFEIPKGVYAIFEVEGIYGDILKLIQWVYHEWLPKSGFETTTKPSYTIFIKNHFLEEDKRFKVKYYLPIQYI